MRTTPRGNERADQRGVGVGPGLGVLDVELEASPGVVPLASARRLGLFVSAGAQSSMPPCRCAVPISEVLEELLGFCAVVLLEEVSAQRVLPALRGVCEPV